MVLLFLGMLLLVDVEQRVFRAVSAVVVASLLIATLVEVIKQYPARASLPAEWPIAAGLETAGLHKGDRVASIGNMIMHSWPRLAQTQVVAEVPQDSVTDFWNATRETQEQVLDVFRRAGARVLVGSVPDTFKGAGWTRVPGTNTWYLFLDRK